MTDILGAVCYLQLNGAVMTQRLQGEIHRSLHCKGFGLKRQFLYDVASSLGYLSVMIQLTKFFANFPSTHLKN